MFLPLAGSPRYRITPRYPPSLMAWAPGLPQLWSVNAGNVYMLTSSSLEVGVPKPNLPALQLPQCKHPLHIQSSLPFIMRTMDVESDQEGRLSQVQNLPEKGSRSYCRQQQQYCEHWCGSSGCHPTHL